MASAEQDQWKEIIAAVRADLAKRAELLPAMKPEEVGSFIMAVDDAMWCEIKAESYDEAVEERKRTLEREAAFGG